MPPPARATGEDAPPHVERILRLASFVSALDRFTIPPLIVPIHASLGISLRAAAAVATAYFIAYGVGQPLWGAASDRFGRVRVMRGAVIGGALACALAAAAPTLPALLGARAVGGLLVGAVVPTAITYVGDTIPVRRRQPALARTMAASSLGTGCATVGAGALAQVASWRLAFLVPGTLAALLAWQLRRLPEPAAARATRSLRSRLRAVATHRWVLAVIALAVIEGAVVFGSLTFIAAALQKSGSGAALAGSAAAGFGFANAAASPLLTRVIPRVASPLLVLGGGGLLAAGLILVAHDVSVATALACTVCLGVAFGAVHSTLQVWATQVYPEARALTIAFFAGALFCGGAAASALAAPLAERGAFATIFAGTAAGAVVLAVSGALLRRRWLLAR